MCGKILEGISSHRAILEFLCRGLEGDLQLKVGPRKHLKVGLQLCVCSGSFGGTACVFVCVTAFQSQGLLLVYLTKESKLLPCWLSRALPTTPSSTHKPSSTLQPSSSGQWEPLCIPGGARAEKTVAAEGGQAPAGSPTCSLV